jgi:hypothetical protein
MAHEEFVQKHMLFSVDHVPEYQQLGRRRIPLPFLYAFLPVNIGPKFVTWHEPI